jgi:anti-sigma28 factor (negative regulator of flagellin synthesis)
LRDDPHTARQFVADMCTEPQNESKLFDLRDDKLSVSGMHNNSMIFYTLKQNTKHKVWSHMQNLTSTTPEYDISRIDSIRAQLNEDNYFVDTRQIADKFIDMELALADCS